MKPRIIALNTANPQSAFTQTEVLQEVLKSQALSGDARGRCEKFFLDKAIETRYLGLERIADVFRETPDESLERFTKVAAGTGSEASRKALNDVGLTANDIDALVVTTCTGYLCPGLSSYISQSLGLRPDAFLVDMVGQGCAAAIPALRTADHYLQSHPQSRVLCVCVEVCSAAFCEGEEVDLLLSNAIFGDGAAACVLTNSSERPGIEVLRYVTMLAPEHREELRFKTRNARLCNVLGRSVPVLASRAVERLIRDLVPAGETVDHYAFHSGGRAILDRIQELLSLTDEDMRPTRKVLRRYGNMSSPSVLFVIKELFDQRVMRSGESIAFFSYGAGFTAHGAFGRWSETLGHPRGVSKGQFDNK